MAKKFDFLSPGVEIREIDQSFIPAQPDALGPIIIGRTRKGPANKPVKVKNLDDFVSVFGLPVAGGNGTQGDVWREGNTVGPTYASYAAQAWLASEESPVTIVRIAGEQHSQANPAGYAGWNVGSNNIAATGDNSTAYGLFVCDEADAGQNTTIIIGAHGSFDAAELENDVVRSRFFRAGQQHPTTAATGLKFEIVFEDNASTLAAGAVDRVASAGGSDNSVAQITCGVNGFTTITQVLAVVEDAINLAITSGDVANISLDNNGTTLTIHNTQVGSADGDQFGVSDAQNNRDQFIVTGVDPQTQGDEPGTSIRNQVGVVAVGATSAAVNGSLAAVFYCVTGALALSGTIADGHESAQVEAGALIESVGANREFKLAVFNAAGTITEEIQFNFSRNNSRYIRNQFNTNPQLTNSTTIAADDLKTYWLGESFLTHLDTNVAGVADAAATYAILLPLGRGTDSTQNWGYHRYAAREAKSGWVFSQKATNSQKLFRFKSLHVGEDIQRNYLIAIEQITAPQNPAVDGYGSFTVCIKDIAGNTVERYTGCNLNPSSPDYVAARIGDQYQVWNDTDKRYRTIGDFQNQSNIIYIEMNENIANGGGQGFLPAGFYGPVRPKGFALLSGDAEAKTLDLTSDFTGSVVQAANAASLFKGQTDAAGEIADLGLVESVKFVFPKMKMRDSGSDGGAADQARVYWGIRPKISVQSNQHDPDFVDYTRALGMGLGEEGTHTPANSNFEYSFTFCLDDVSGSTTTGEWTWTEGNYAASNSYSQTNSFNELLDANVRQFIMPMWGGSEGLDITEMEPLRNELISTTTLDEKNSYVDYSISKALDSIADSEVVPANLLTVPGIFQPPVTNKVINIAERRKDVLSIIDLEGDYRPRVELNDTGLNRLGSVTDAISNLKTRNLNSSYACAFYPAIQVSDNLNGGQLVWLPASVGALGAFARSQAQSDVWFAPAGFNRGGLGSLGGSRGPRVLQARQRLDSKERDLLYEQNINPIATFPAEGVVIFGQKTLQADNSALDRINVRRLLLFLKHEVSLISKNLLFDQNLDSTWARFKSQVEPVLSSTQARFGLSSYKLVLDETTTTADLVDRNIMYAKIFVKPARAIEYIVVDFIITRTGADFV